MSLAALVAAALRAPPATSVRPVGQPFMREIKADPSIAGGSLGDENSCFAIVDEGPGLSGSSFAAAATWLARQGVDLRRIHFFASHGGEPGAAASSTSLNIWKACSRHPARAEDVLFGHHGLRSWVAEQVGPLQGALTQLPQTIAVHRVAGFERPKFLVRGQEQNWLIKFTGLGEIGQRKFRDARALGQAGFSPPAKAVCHGFLVQHWVSGQPLAAAPKSRAQHIRLLAEYLSFRSQRLGTPSGGASIEQLCDMATNNTLEALGRAAANRLKRRLSSFGAVDALIEPVRTDNRMHVWEWIRHKGGVIKIDAIDHCEAHDLIGCQDIAWDVAGSAIEHKLSASELGALCREMAARGVQVEPVLLSAMIPCYLAFQIGLWSSEQRDVSQVPLAGRYARKLASWLNDSCAPIARC
jgi:hypothetical protein